MNVGYARISSTRQLLGYGLEVQEKEIMERYPDAVIYKEQCSGIKADRPVFKALLDNLSDGDVLIVSKLDRLARNTTEGIKIIETLFNRNIAVHVLNIGLLENSSMGKFFITTLLAIAEMERNTIMERTAAGKELARQDPNFKEGRPKKFTPDRMRHALQLLEGGQSYKAVETLTGISKSTLVRAMREKRAKNKD